MTEKLLKVALSAINQPTNQINPEIFTE